MRFFQSVTTEEQLKKAYRELAKKHHPDQGGNHEDFIALKKEYEELAGKFNSNTKGEDQYPEIINELMKYQDIEIEIIGSWVWVTGKTFPIKTQLKEAGLNFSKRKKAWYWNGGQERKRRYKGSYSLDEIRDMHHREVVKKRKENYLN